MEKAFLDNAFALFEDTDVDDDDPETTDVWGWPALLDALSKGQFETALALLDKGASLASVTPGGLSAIHVVCGGAGQQESVQSVAFLDVLLKRGAQADALDNQKKTPLYHAACVGNVITARRLLEAGASASEGEGDSPLLRAVMLDNKEFVEILLAAGARDDGAYRKGFLRGVVVFFFFSDS